MRRWRQSGLTLVLLTLFAGTLAGHIWSGFRYFNKQQEEHGHDSQSLSDYLTSGHFLESVAENGESEFLQMAVFVLLTTFLYQKGSPESKDPDAHDPVDEDPAVHRDNPRAPWPVRKGGIPMRLYAHSLGATLFLLFAISFMLHALGGLKEYNDERSEHGRTAVLLGDYLRSSQRQRGSSQSKPVAASHDDHGD